MLLVPVSTTTNNQKSSTTTTTRNVDDIDGDDDEFDKNNNNNNKQQTTGEAPPSNLPIDLTNVPSWWQQVLAGEKLQPQHGSATNSGRKHNHSHSALLHDATNKERGAFSMMDEELSVMSDDELLLMQDGNNNNNNNDYYDNEDDEPYYDDNNNNEDEEARELRLARRAQVSHMKQQQRDLYLRQVRKLQPFYPSGNPQQHLHPTFYHVHQAIKKTHEDSENLSHVAAETQHLLLKHRKEQQALLLMMNHHNDNNNNNTSKSGFVTPRYLEYHGRASSSSTNNNQQHQGQTPRTSARNSSTVIPQ